MNKKNRKITSLFVATCIASGVFAPTVAVLAEEKKTSLLDENQETLQEKGEIQTESQLEPVGEEPKEDGVQEESQEKESDVDTESAIIPEDQGNLNEGKESILKESAPVELNKNLLDSIQPKSGDFWSISGTTLNLEYSSREFSLEEQMRSIPSGSKRAITNLELKLYSVLSSEDNEWLNKQTSFGNLTELSITFTGGTGYTIRGLEIPWAETFRSNAIVLGGNTFSGASNLRKLELGVLDTQLANINPTVRSAITDLTLTNKADLNSITGLRSFSQLENLTSNSERVGTDVLREMPNLKSVNMPNATTFGDRPFFNTASLEEVSLPNLTTLGSMAFFNAASLEEMSLPNLTTLGSGAFSGLTRSRLRKLELGVQETQLVNINPTVRSAITDLTLTNKADLNSITGLRSFSQLENLTSNSERVGTDVLREMPNLQSVNMPNATTFGDSAFFLATSLKEVNLPNAITFGDRPFASASLLEEVSLPNATTFGDLAFFLATSLKEVSLPKATIFGDYAFLSASSLKEVSLPNVRTFGSGAFSGEGGSSLKKLNLPKATTFGDNSFTRLAGVKELVLPSVEVLGENAFSHSEIGIIDLPSVVTFPNNSLNSSTIGFVKVNDTDTINYKTLFSGKGNLIGIVNSNSTDEFDQSVKIGSTLGLTESPRLYNTEALPKGSFGLEWTKEGVVVGTEETLTFENVQAKHSGEYVSRIWTTTVPGIEASLMTDLNVHTVDVGEVPTAPLVNALTRIETELTGTGEANGELRVEIEGSEIATGVVKETGDFSIEIGTHPSGTAITVFVSNKYGVSDATVITVEEEMVAPDAPQVDAVTDIDLFVTGTGEVGATVKMTVGGTTIGVGQVTSEGSFAISISPQEAGTVVSVTQQNAGGESTPTEVTVSKTEEIYTTTNIFKLGYWMSYGLVLEGQIMNESWDLSSRSGVEGSLQLVNEGGVVEASSPITSTNWYDSSQYNGYQGIVDIKMIESLTSELGKYELRISLQKNGTELGNEAIELPGFVGLRLLQNFTADFLELPSNHIGTGFITTERKNQTAHLKIEKEDTAIMGLISESLIEEGRAVNGFILNADFDFSQEHQKNVIIETKSGEEVAVIENIHTWDISSWGLGVTNLDMRSGFQVIIPTEYTDTALYQYKMTITEPEDMETEHVRLLLDKIR